MPETQKNDIASDLQKGLDRLEAGGGSVPSYWIPIDKIRPNTYQPRKDFDMEALRLLGEDIKENGQITPITVRQINEPDSPYLFELCAGERRWRGSQLVGLTKILAYIKDLDDSQMKKIAYKENALRVNLNFLENVNFVASMKADGMTTADIARDIKMKERTVQHYVKIHTEMNKVKEIADIFNKRRADVDFAVVSDYASIADSVVRAIKLKVNPDGTYTIGDKREIKRILDKFSKEGVKEAVKGLKKRFTKPDKTPVPPTTTASPSPTYFKETDKEISLHIKVKKGEPLETTELQSIQEAMGKLSAALDNFSVKEVLSDGEKK